MFKYNQKEDIMNLIVIFTVYGIYNILLGLAFLFMPGPTITGAVLVRLMNSFISSNEITYESLLIPL